MTSLLDRVVMGPGPIEHAAARPARARPVAPSVALPATEQPSVPITPPVAVAAPAPIATPLPIREPSTATPVVRTPAAPAPEPRRDVPQVTPPAPPVAASAPRAPQEPARRDQPRGLVASESPRAPAPAPARVEQTVATPPIRERIVVEKPPPLRTLAREIHTREIVHSTEIRTIERPGVVPTRPATVEHRDPPPRQPPAGVREIVRERVVREPSAPGARPVAPARGDEPRTVTIARTVAKPETAKPRKPVPAIVPVTPTVAARAKTARTLVIPAASTRPAPRIDIQIGTIEIRTTAPARRSEPARIPARRHTLAVEGER